MRIEPLEERCLLDAAAMGDPETTALVPVGSVWQYLDDGSDQQTAWRESEFDDSSWSEGPAKLGYGDTDQATTVSYGPDASDKYVTTYFRHRFDVADVDNVSNLTLSLIRDDGAAVYLNGIEILRDNLLPNAGYRILAERVAVLDGIEPIVATVDLELLVEGINTLAVEVHQVNFSSSDISFDLELTAGTFHLRELVVSTTLDEVDDDHGPGDLSLREAILIANAGGQDTRIIVPEGVYTLSLEGRDEDLGETGDLDIRNTSPLDVVPTIWIVGSDAASGNLAGRTIIDGGGIDRVFEVFGGVDVHMEGITIRGGNGDLWGGGIRNQGTLSLSGVVVEENSSGFGGGVHNDGDLHVENSVFTHNVARGDGGAISNSGTLMVIGSMIGNNEADEWGAGVLNMGTAELVDTSVFGGTTRDEGAGIYSSGPLILRGVQVYDNQSARGAGLYAGNTPGDTTIIDSEFRNNHATSASGGAIHAYGNVSFHVTNTLFDENSAGDYGGAISIGTAMAVFSRVEILNSQAGFKGGGVAVRGGNALFIDSTFSGNSTLGDGGAIAVFSEASLGFNRSSATDNDSEGQGGAIYFARRSSGTVNNSTISGNSGFDYGGGLSIGDFAEVAIRHSTITQNIVNVDAFARGGGVYSSEQSQALLDHTIVAGNWNDPILSLRPTAPDDVAGVYREGSRFTLVGSTHEPIPGLPAGENGNKIGLESFLDPGLGPLAENGGPTLTHLLLPESPAIDRGDPNLAFIAVIPGPTDQRGLPRLADGDGDGRSVIDIGSVEVESVIPPRDELVVSILEDEDDGDYSTDDLSLREAIILANQMPGDQTILVPQGHYRLSIEGRDEDAAATGDLDITDTGTDLGATVTIRGASRGGTIIDGMGLDRVFDVHTGARAIFENLTIQGGHADVGGGINIADGCGGPLADCIGNNATASLINSTIRDNRADERGGGIHAGPFAPLSIRQSSVRENTAGLFGGGVFSVGEPLSITDTLISRNEAISGGGLYLGTQLGFEPTEIVSSLIIGNVATGVGGGVHVATGMGGGVRSLLTVTSTTVSGNRAGRNGGGFFVDEDSTLRLERSTVNDNRSGDSGGGIAMDEDSHLEISKSTISGNHANKGGGGVFVYDGSTASISQSTITLNSARVGGGVFKYDDGQDGYLELDNSIIAGNAVVCSIEVCSLLDIDIESDDIRGAVSPQSSYNLVGIVEGSEGIVDGENGNQVGSVETPLDPRLVPLGNNGGPTQTHALREDSPALDMGDPALSLIDGPPALIDQRGLPRVVDGNGDGVRRIDIGSFESQRETINLRPVAEDDFYETGVGEPLVVGIPTPRDPGGALQEVQFVETGSIWKYLDDGSNQGVAWQQPDFNDSTWAAGPSQLGYGEDDEATVISYGDDPSNKHITTYFRHEFTFEGGAIDELMIELLRDDGAAVYLNGVEVIRDSLPGEANYQTLASVSAGGNGENSFFPFAVDASLLVEGRNVLAVEVHQISSTSSDVGFDLRVSGLVGPPPISDGVLANDFDPEGAPLTAILETPPPHGSLDLNPDGGFVYVPHDGFAGIDTFTYVANDGERDSEVATVSILVGDSQNRPPVAVDDDYRIEPGEILVAGGFGIHNVTEMIVDPEQAEWRYLDDGSDQGDDWISPEFNDERWALGPGKFGYGNQDEVTEIRAYKQNSNERVMTTYFRHSFNIDVPQMVTSLTLGLLRDGGAAVYLNGVEIRRDNLAPDAAFDDAATAGVVGADENTFFESLVDPSLLVAGTNVLAVELHNNCLVCDDIGFNLSFAAEFAVPIPPPAPDAPGVLENDYDPDGDPLTAQLLEGPAFGNLEFHADGSFVYIPADDFVGSDTFVYLANDGAAESQPATVTIEVGEVHENHAPVAVSDAYVVAAGGVLETTAERAPSGGISVVLAGSVWAYLDDGSDQGTEWRGTNFNDADWSRGPAQLGYGDGDEATVVDFGDQPRDKHITTYFRREFVLPEIALIDRLTLGLLRDDGAVVYLNGVEVVRDALAAAAGYDDLAVAVAGGISEEVFFQFPIDPGLLVDGVNLLAVEVHQVAPTSSDLSFDLRLVASGPIELRPPGVLANDVDLDGDTLTASLVTEPAHGTLSLREDGSFRYVPHAGFVGQDGFTYIASDALAASNVAAVSIQVGRDGPMIGDMDDNERVDLLDLAMLRRAMLVGIAAAGPLDGDWNHDEIVDRADLAEMVRNFGRGRQEPAGAAAAALRVLVEDGASVEDVTLDSRISSLLDDSPLPARRSLLAVRVRTIRPARVASDRGTAIDRAIDQFSQDELRSSGRASARAMRSGRTGRRVSVAARDAVILQIWAEPLADERQ